MSSQHGDHGPEHTQAPEEAPVQPSATPGAAPSAGDVAGSGASASEGQPREEHAAYEALRSEVRRTLDRAAEALSAESLKKAVEDATRALREAGEYTAETVAKVAETLKKDLLSAARGLEPGMNRLTDTAGGLLEELRNRGGHIVALAAKAIGDWSRELGERLDNMLTYHTGDVTHGGTFACNHCGTTVTLKKTGHLPPCPKCHKTEFRRV